MGDLILIQGTRVENVVDRSRQCVDPSPIPAFPYPGDPPSASLIDRAIGRSADLAREKGDHDGILDPESARAERMDSDVLGRSPTTPRFNFKIMISHWHSANITCFVKRQVELMQHDHEA